MSGKILIVDDVATNRIVLKVKLAAAFYDTIQAADGAEALRLALSERPDLILLDIDLPDIDGISVCERLKADPATCHVPVIIVTSLRDDEARMRALRAGAEDYLLKPADEMVLLARMRGLLRARETEEELHYRDTARRDLGFAEAAPGFELPGNVALVAAGPEQALRWQIGLSAQLCDTITTLDAEDVLAETTTHPVPDIFVIAADLGRSGQGLRLMSELRSRPATRHAAICIVVDPGAPEAAAMALDLGANDLIPTDFRPEELALRVAKQLKRKRLADRLRASVTDGLRLAVIDPLTGLYNRRYALPQLARIADRALDTGRNFAVMVLDLDRFKSVNDTWGHAAGDAVLVEVAARLSANLRAVDLIARYGGEEFLIALPDTTLEAARIAAERLRQGIEERPIRLPGGAGEASVTVSIGLAMGTGTQGGIDLIVEQADHALLGSKSDGRNQVTISRTAA